MAWRYGDFLLERIKSGWVCYLLVAAIFLCGTCAGAYSVKFMGPEELTELSAYVSVFVKRLGSEDYQVSPLACFLGELSQMLRNVSLMWLLGVTVIGIPVVWAIVFVRGFASGFSVAFLIQEMGVGGALFGTCAVLPQSLFSVPSLLLAGGLSTAFSWRILQHRRAGRKIDFLGEFVSYTWCFVASLVLAIGGAIVEGWISPIFMRVASNIIAR
ncbi:MAG TPA: stage II sporulation protein M [Firmicutes bacterium]|nr:stage II sporulation protein M [Bacillota bacterium]